MKILKIAALISLVTGVIGLVSGIVLVQRDDPHRYKGEQVALYTVAVNSIFGAEGRDSNGEAVFDPRIELLEEDKYGRILFYYCEFYYNNYAIVIMQKQNDDTVFFYEDICYEITDSSFYKDGIYDSNDELFLKLKERNDWDKEFDETKCVKKPLETKHKGSLNVPEKTFKKIINTYVENVGYEGDDTIYRSDEYVTSDNYGRELFYAYGVGENTNSTYQYFKFAIIINPDGTYNQETCIMELGSMDNIREKIIVFKQLNEWNLPYTAR